MTICRRHAEQRSEPGAYTHAQAEYEQEAALRRARGVQLSGPLNASKTVWKIAHRRARLLARGLRPVGVPLAALNTDLNTEARQAWLRFERQPRIVQQTPQSNFEQSLPCRLGLLFAAIVIGIQLFSPDPDAPTTTHAPSTVQTGHVRPLV